MALVTLFSAFFLALIVPGQDFVMVVRLSVSRSLRTGVAAAAGSATGLLFWGIAAMAGVSALLEHNAQLALTLRLGGAALLVAFGLYGAVRALLARPAIAPGRAPGELADPMAVAALAPDPAVAYPFARGWRAGLLSNLTNVKLLIFFATLFSSLLPAELSTINAAAILIAMAALAFGWFTLIALLGSRPRISAAYQRASRQMDVVFGLVFVAIGVALLTSVG